MLLQKYIQQKLVVQQPPRNPGQPRQGRPLTVSRSVIESNCKKPLNFLIRRIAKQNWKLRQRVVPRLHCSTRKHCELLWSVSLASFVAKMATSSAALYESKFG